MRKTANDQIGSDFRGRSNDLFIAERIRQPDIRGDVARKKENVLLHVPDQRAQLLERHRANVDAIDSDSAALRIVESHQEIDDCRLSSSSVPNERQRLSGTRRKAYPFENPFDGDSFRLLAALLLRQMGEVVREPHIFKRDLDPPRFIPNPHPIGAVRNGGHCVEKREDPLRARHRRLKNVVFLRQILQRLKEAPHQL